MEIRLAKIYDNFPEEEIKIEFLDELTLEQFDCLNDAIKEIEELNSVRRLLSFVEINEKEMISYLQNSAQELLEKSINWNGVKRKDGDERFLNCNRMLLNYLSSIRTFLDHTQTFVIQKFGAESVEFAEFKSVTSFYYDNSFAYRFFYKLRNYAQHVGLPINSFQFSHSYDAEINLMRGTLSLSFDRDKLLSTYNSWGNLKDELSSMPEMFDVIPLVGEMTFNIKEVEGHIEILHRKSLLLSANYISSLINHLPAEGETIVARLLENKSTGELGKFEIINIPFEAIGRIQELIN